MNNLTPKRELNTRKWLDIIRVCRTSGLTVNAWCSENGIRRKSYYYWLAKFRRQAADQLPERTALKTIVPAPVFAEIPLKRKPVPCADPVSIKIGNAVISLPQGSSPEMVNAVIRAVSLC